VPVLNIDKELNMFIYRTPSYKLLKWSKFLVYLTSFVRLSV